MNTPSQSRFIAFFDECGDHSLDKIDRDFPLFVLSTVIVERSAYTEIVVPKLAALKLEFWNHEGINLHSRDIRKAYGDFEFLSVPHIRHNFLERLTALMAELPFTLFITAIRKQSHRDRYGEAATNPYSLALTYTFERVLHFLEHFGEQELPVTAEARGKNEDNQLAAAFLQIMTEGTRYNSAKRFQSLQCSLSFRRKSDNVAGMQIADLCAHPSARSLLHPNQANHAFAVVEQHLYRNGNVSGWKVFP